ncbi:MAG: hypothetical protein AABY36_05715, partial [Campylobacterota bacterium]
EGAGGVTAFQFEKELSIQLLPQPTALTSGVLPSPMVIRGVAEVTGKKSLYLTRTPIPIIII